MLSSLNVRFSAPPSKKNKQGTVPLTLTITVDNKRTCVILPRRLRSKDFNSKKQRSNDADLNHFMDIVKSQLFQIHTQLIANNEKISAEIIKSHFLGKETKKDWKLLELYQEHIDELEKGIGKTIVKATHLKHTKVREYVFKFLKTKHNRSDISMTKINQGMLWDLYNFLLIDMNLKQNTVVGYMTKLKKIVRIAVNHKYIKENPFQGMTLRLEKTDPDFLTQTELDVLIHKDLNHIKRLEQVRDIFIFNAYTGLCFADSKALSSEHISQDEQGNFWIRKPRQKTGVMARIPLLPIALTILEKYHWKLPVPSCQKMNTYLYEIAEICNIRKKLTTHCARHTMATNFLSHGVSIEAVSKILGHTNIKMTQHYARLLDDSILRAVQVMK